MNFNIEVARAGARKGRPPEWVWRVRSDDDKLGSTCITVGINAPSEQVARDTANLVKAALLPIFNRDTK